MCVHIDNKVLSLPLAYQTKSTVGTLNPWLELLLLCVTNGNTLTNDFILFFFKCCLQTV